MGLDRPKRFTTTTKKVVSTVEVIDELTQEAPPPSEYLSSRVSHQLVAHKRLRRFTRSVVVEELFSIDPRLDISPGSN